jgi:hypothetical protein
MGFPPLNRRNDPNAMLEAGPVGPPAIVTDSAANRRGAIYPNT